MIDPTQPLTPWTREQCIAHIKEQDALGRQNRELNGWHSIKLHPVDAREILELLAEGILTQKQIANRFRVSQPVISRIKLGKAWKNAA